jgi:two-component system, cell cycle sensor histidine kinase and response regulator CckA
VVEQILGYRPEEILHQHFYDFFHPDDRESFKAAALAAFAARQPFQEFLNRNVHKNGQTVWLSTSGIPMLDDKGNLLGYRGADTDITERKQTEAALREREEQFSAMFQLASIGMAQADVRTGQFLRVNDKMCAITGYSADEMLKLRLSEITHPEDRERDWEAFQRVVRREAPDYRLEKRYLRKDGTPVWVNVNMTVIRDADGLPARTIATIEDITERRQAEDKLRQLSRAVDQSPSSIVITDPAGDIEYVNPKFIELTGYTLAEVLGKNPRVLKSGEKSPEAYRELWQTITAGKEWRGEFHNKKKNGELYWESASISPIRDRAGRVTHYVAVKEDITARKQTEAERDQLIQDLQNALANVKALSGLLPICDWCKKIRDDKGYWSQVESYLEKNSEATFTHSLCPDCSKAHFPDMEKAAPGDFPKGIP